MGLHMKDPPHNATILYSVFMDNIVINEKKNLNHFLFYPYIY